MDKSEFAHHLERLVGPPSQCRLVLGVSGGMDSMVMLHAIKAAGYTVLVAHVNYGLRGEDSLLDERLVKAYCEQSGIECLVWRPVHFTTDMKGIQEKARNERYAFFEKLLTERSFDRIAVAHHADDQAETIAMQFFRGGRLKALRGMSHISHLIVRPMLRYLREDIEKYALHYGVLWREDVSNLEEKYLRNKMRNSLIPSLEVEFPGVASRFVSNATYFAEVEQWLQHTIGVFLHEHMQFMDNSERLSRLVLHASKASRLILWQWLQEKDFTAEQIESISAVPNEHSGVRFNSKEGTLWVEREQLVWRPHRETPGSDAVRISHPLRLLNPLVMRSELAEVPKTWQRNAHEAWFSEDWMGGEWRMRKWREGDRMSVFGSGQSQLVSDILQQAKMPHSIKADVWIMERNGEVVWIPGVRQCNTGRVPDGSTRALRCSLDSSNPMIL
jgi:tRNA(Ile)-lysidine synthase